MPAPPGHIALTLDGADWLRAAAAQAGPHSIALADTLLASLASLGIPTRVTVHVPLPDVATSDAGPAAADPVVVMAALARAVEASDAALGAQHLVVAGGEIASRFVLDAGAGGRATGRVALRISPRPYR